MEKQGNDREFEKRIFHLKTLHDLVRETCNLHDQQQILKNLLLMTMGNFGTGKGVIILFRLKGNKMEAVIHRGMTDSEMYRLTKLLTEGGTEPLQGKRGARMARSLRIFIPFTVDKEIAGGIGLGRKISGESYTSDDRELLETIASQGAVAIGNARLLEQLGKRVFHLKTLYDTTREIDFLLDPREILRHLLMMTLGSFGSGSGIALLVDNGQDKLEAITHRGLDETKMAHLQKRLEKEPLAGFFDVSSTTILETKGVENSGRKDGSEKSRLTDVFSSLEMQVWVPFSVNESSCGGIALGEKIVGEPYTQDDLELLDTLASLGAAAIKNAKLLEQMKRDEIVRVNFARYLSPQIVEKIVQHDVQVNLGGDRKVVTVLFTDIRNFTTITEGRQPDQLVQILNEYFTEMAKVIFANQGSLDKYIGDALVAVFGSLIPLESPPRNAVAAAIGMMKKVVELNRHWETRYAFSMNIGIGVSTGEVFLGNIGSPERMEFTVIGDAVNVASRFSGLARGGQILVTKPVAENLGETFRLVTLPHAEVKGKTGKMEVFEVLYVQPVS